MKLFRAVALVAACGSVCAFGQAVFNTGQAARLIIGQKNFTYADFGATNQLIGSPGGLAYANGVLWVADSNRLGSTPDNNRILRFSDISTYPSPTEKPDIPGSTCGVCRGTASLVLGQPDFSSTNARLTNNGFRKPVGVATDGKALAVADADNNRVLIWLNQPTANGQPADVVVGQADFTHSAVVIPPTASSLRAPTGVWISGGKLYIADTQNNRVLIYNKIPTTNNAAADVVLGQPDFTTFVQVDLTQPQPAVTASSLQSPVSVTTDATHLFVADLANSRVLIWNTIPTTNNAPANVAIGQPDLVSSGENRSYRITDASLDTLGNPKGVEGILCKPYGTDTDGFVTYAPRCAATLSYPRFALSDGTRLFVADGGNDRVLVFNTIPTTNGKFADAVLGQPDEVNDNTGQNPDGTNAFQTPTSLAWDGTNLYVSDTFNRRVVLHSPGTLSIPLDGVRNAASQEIYAIGQLQFGGTVTAKDTVTITVAGKDYLYTVLATDTPDTIVTNLARLINTAPDPNVTATSNAGAGVILLTAKTPGAPGGTVTIATSASTNATFSGAAESATLNIYLQNPSQLAPGTLVQIMGSNLCDTVAIGDLSQPYLPTTLEGCTLYVDGMATPLLYVSPTQINVQMPYEVTDRTSISMYVRQQNANGTVRVSVPVATTIVAQNPGLFALDGTDPRPGIVYHASRFAYDIIAVDGRIQADDTFTLTVSGRDYKVTVAADDTLDKIRDRLAALVNTSGDPDVRAVPVNSYHRLLLYANVPGPAGAGIAVSAVVTAGTANTDTGPLLFPSVFFETTSYSNSATGIVTVDNPAIPGEILYTFATGLGLPQPSTIDTGKVFPGGDNNPSAVQVDSILAGGLTAQALDVALVPGTVGVYSIQFALSPGVATSLAAQMTIAQLLFVSNVVTFPVFAP